MWVVVAQVFVFFLLPETKGVPLDEMEIVWRRHWFWKRFMPLLDIGCENLPKKQGTLAPMTTNPNVQN
jgi:hypothetical protein